MHTIISSVQILTLTHLSSIKKQKQLIKTLAALTHLFHEFLIVLTAINFPGAIESHGGGEGELDNSAARSALVKLGHSF